VRQYANSLLPTLQSDFKEAQDLEMKFLTPAKKSVAAARTRKVAHASF
jgi:hypothetical protein